jgi:RsiW-degrading membrane proteinase PrsW (M82 family)
MFLILALLSVLCATVPMLAFLFLVWFLDRHDREPIWLFGLTFLWGAIGSILFALIGSSLAMVPLVLACQLVEPLTGVPGAIMADQLSAVLVAPLVEEPMKALILFAVMFSRHFDNATDGFVYGAAAGLGFGMTENFLYFVQVASMGDTFSWLMTVVIRTFFSALMHACATSCVGAMLGFARFRGLGWKIMALPIGFGVAIAIHATWNGLLTVDAFTGSGLFTLANFVLFPLEFLTLFVVFQFALWDERRTIRRELADEVSNQVMPLGHAQAIAGYFSRSRAGWLDARIPQGAYVKAATTLAIRKHQCRNASQGAYGFYSDEVLRLRKEVQALQALAPKGA